MKSIVTSILLMIFSSAIIAGSGKNTQSVFGDPALYKEAQLNLATSNEDVPPPKYYFHVSYPLPNGYPNKGVEGHNEVGGTVYVYTSESTGTIKKPIIMPEAFDPENSREWDSLYIRMNAQNTLECLRSLGYDFIVIDYDEGGNYIEHNAYLLAKVIEWVNTVKATPEKNVVFGPSMGGLVARYALTYMENQNINHDTRLFISFDSPQYGANVPLGLQYMIRYWKEYLLGNDAAEKFKILETPAARQMLLYHIINTRETGFISPDPLRISFEQNLHALGDWPAKLRKIAISNGSGNGLFQLKNDNVTRLQPGDKIMDFSVTASIFSRVWALPDVVSTRIARCKAGADTDPNDYTVSGTRPFDNMPGGYRGFTGEMKDVTNTAGAFKQCFIPTFSALAIATNENYYSPRFDPDVMNKTPFDAIYFPVENQGHVTITPENKNWIMNEIRPAYLQVNTTYLPNKGVAMIQAANEIHLLPGFSTNTNPEFRIFIQEFTRCNSLARTETGDHVETAVLTGIQDAENQDNGIAVYPNPATDKVTIETHGNVFREIQLMYADGRLIKTIQPQSSSCQLDMSELNAGMYLIKIVRENQSIVRKIVLTR